MAERSSEAEGQPSWSRLADIPGCVCHRPNLKRTTLTAAVVGTVLFCINHLASVLADRASTATWVATGISYVVPFCVANIGLLAVRRAPAIRNDRPNVSVTSNSAPPTWRRHDEVLTCVLYRRHLRRTVNTALVVGTVYFVVNQLPTILGGGARASNWIESAITYLVPFCVANVGVLVGTRRAPELAAG